MANNSIKFSVVIHYSILVILIELTHNSLLIFTILFFDTYWYNYVYAIHFTWGDPTGAPYFMYFKHLLFLWIASWSEAFHPTVKVVLTWFVAFYSH